MLQVTDYVMRFAPLAVFAAVAATHRRARPRRSSRTYGYFIGELLSRPVLLWALLIGARLPGRRAAARCSWSRYIREPVVLAFSTASSEAAYPAHAGGARPVRRAAADRQLRPAARLFVQSRRLDDVHDLRDDCSSPRPMASTSTLGAADRDAADPDGHLQGHGRRAARQPGGDRRDALASSTSPRPGCC